MPGAGVHVRAQCSHAAAHKHSEPHVMPNSDRGLDADGLTEMKHIRASLYCQSPAHGQKKVLNANRDKTTHNMRNHQNPLVMILKLNCNISTAAWVDMKGIQAYLVSINRSSNRKHVGFDNNLQRVRMAGHSDGIHLLRFLSLRLLLLLLLHDFGPACVRKALERSILCVTCRRESKRGANTESYKEDNLKIKGLHK
ncbi:hypothetical protein F7725_003537 [Dissostichus mawsoni]|uniref:Uncharacterized protein n=1 Tax=Dissostichus mawsoni TaxID=36200 RepID=A0A7J5YCH3_DISMA|nr:hypothetical protein F7725_003537 [Dissostichus mawsoni]